MGERTAAQEALFFSSSLERHVPVKQLLRSIDRFVDLSAIHEHLKQIYSETGRPSIGPEPVIRMLVVGYCMGIRSERRLCEGAHLNLAYRWLCRLGLEGDALDYFTFSQNRHRRVRDSDLLHQVFEATVESCMAEGLVGCDESDPRCCPNELHRNILRAVHAVRAPQMHPEARPFTPART